ncbi:hypothetical protein GCM10027614_61710 [Micromonospora vulcania]
MTLGAAALLLPRSVRAVLATAGAVAVLLALPVGWAAAWPAVVAVDLVGGTVLLLAVLARPAVRPGTLLARALGGAVLLGHGLLVSLAAPAGALVSLGTVVVVGLALAARRAPGRTAGSPAPACWPRSSRCREAPRWWRSPRAPRPGGRRASRCSPPRCR